MKLIFKVRCKVHSLTLIRYLQIPKKIVNSWRRTTCEQGLIYREEQKKIIDAHRGQYVYMQDGKVVWNGSDPTNLGSRRKLSGDRKDSALWLKYVDPDDKKKENVSSAMKNVYKQRHDKSIGLKRRYTK